MITKSDVDRATRAVRAKLESTCSLLECARLVESLLDTSDPDEERRQLQLLYAIGWIDARYPVAAAQYEREANP